MKRLDYILIPLLFLLTLLPLFLFHEEGKSVLIKNDDKTYLYDLSVDRVIHVDGALGKTTIEIKDKAVRITSSPCENKTCMKSKIHNYPESLVCLPNRVIVQIMSKGEIDAISY